MPWSRDPFRDFIDSGGRDSVVGIATRCRLEGQGIVSQWGEIFSVVHTNLKASLPPLKWIMAGQLC
jgi:hypothetical protein